MAGKASLIQFIGRYETQGGAGSGGEVGAAGTMLLTDHYHDSRKTLLVYNRQGKGVSGADISGRFTSCQGSACVLGTNSPICGQLFIVFVLLLLICRCMLYSNTTYEITQRR